MSMLFMHGISMIEYGNDSRFIHLRSFIKRINVMQQ